MNQELFESVDNYISELLGEEDEALKDAVLSMEEANIPPMNISANQGKFLQVLAITANAKNIRNRYLRWLQHDLAGEGITCRGKADIAGSG